MYMCMAVAITINTRQTMPYIQSLIVVEFKREEEKARGYRIKVCGKIRSHFVCRNAHVILLEWHAQLRQTSGNRNLKIAKKGNYIILNLDNYE